jgi:SAM-dependent methyltransferase
VGTRQSIDFGARASDYARFRRGPDGAFFEKLSTFGVGLPGQRIIDLGTGTGLFARALVLRGSKVTGIDPSEPLLTEARKLDQLAGVQVDYLTGVAEHTGLSPAIFDCVTASTCWHWFDRQRAAREAHRLLKSNGKLVIAALDWLRLPDNVIDATLKILEQHQASSYAGPRTFLYPDWTSDLVAAGFKQWEAFAYTTKLNYAHEAWCGRVRASADIAGFDSRKLASFSADFMIAMRRQFPREPLEVDHTVFCLIAEK